MTPNYDPRIHHRRSIRLKDFDYSQAGAYFITICCHHRKHAFGNIHRGEMRRNYYGNIAHSQWLRTAEIRPNISLGNFVIMPNHMHGIIIIRHRLDENAPKQIGQFAKPISNSISTIVGGYKAIVTNLSNKARETYGEPLWQRNYYEHVIRTENDFDRISNYIFDNPKNWKEDCFNGEDSSLKFSYAPVPQGIEYQTIF